MKQRAIDTDELALTRAFERKFKEALEPINGCFMYPRMHITVERRGHGTVTVQAPRVAFALAHPETHLSRDDLVIHTCNNPRHGNDPLQPICCTPSHLEKGDAKLRELAIKVRKAK